MLRSSRWVMPLLLAASHGLAGRLAAQWQANTGPAGAALGAVVGGDVERYVRALSLAGVTRPVAWGARPIGTEDLDAILSDSAVPQHPWRTALARATRKRLAVGATAFASVNSGFAWGANDGPLWQGRGVNFALGGAAQWRRGRVSIVAAPVAFVAMNQSFPLLKPPAFSRSPFADPSYPLLIDLPQRMGASSYMRLDPGESSIRVRMSGLVAGVSTASSGWGTGESFPAILGPNAGGFPHLFVGSRANGFLLNDIGRVHAHYVLGTLDQSAWSPVQGSTTYLDAQQTGTRRVGTGLVLSFEPAFLPQLELGATRFFHSPNRAGASRWDAWTKPFSGIFKSKVRDSGGALGDTDNQLASFFARWVFPSRGVEANIELLREDHNFDSRDLAQEPENNSAVLASLRAVTGRSARALGVLTFEYFDGDVRAIGQAREQGFMYIHGGMPQGHTQRGQLLGSPIGAGAIGGQRMAWERFTEGGSFRVNLQRWRTRSIQLTEYRGLYVQALTPIPDSHDWIVDGSVAATRTRAGRSLTLEGGLAWAGVWHFGDSRSNVYLRASVAQF